MTSSDSVHTGARLLTGTIKTLQQGLTGVPISTAITNIDEWYPATPRRAAYRVCRTWRGN